MDSTLESVFWTWIIGVSVGLIVILLIRHLLMKRAAKNEREVLNERPFSVTVRCGVSAHPTDHTGAHRRLNGALRELVTDWMGATGAKIATSTVVELLVWSKTQAMKPDHDWPGNGEYEYFIDREITKYLEAKADKAISDVVARMDAQAASEEKNEEGPNAVHQ